MTVSETRADFQEVCIECGHKFGVWFAANPLWNRVIPSRVGMLCPCCFIVRAEKAGVECTGWQLVPENLQAEPKHEPWCASVERPFDAVMRRGPYPCDCRRAEPSRGAPEAQRTELLIPSMGPLQAKWFDPKCYDGCQSLLLKAEVEKFMEVANKNAQERNAAVDREVVLLEALRRIDECVNDTTVAWESRLYQIKRYTEKAIKEAECRQK